MNRTSLLLIRLAVLAGTVVGLVLITTGQATARICVDPADGSPVTCPPTDFRRLIDEVETRPVQPVTDTSDWTLQWLVLAAAVLGALAIVAVMADVLVRRRWQQPQLETALGSSDPDELPRAAGLLGDLFVQQNHAGAAEHAYRAAIEVGNEYWSPIAQTALAQLLNDQGHREEAQALLEKAIASDHPRTASVAQAALRELSTNQANRAALGRLPETYETLSDPASARRS